MDRVYLNHQADTFNIDNAMAHQILFKMFIDMDAVIYAKCRKAMQDG